MTKKFKEKIMNASAQGYTVTHGKYIYDVFFSGVKNCHYIVRCKRDLLRERYIDTEGNIHDYWEYLEPLD